jgi:hypothetical protein
MNLIKYSNTASQAIPNHLQHPYFHCPPFFYHFHNSGPFVPILSHMNPISKLTPYFFKRSLNNILPYTSKCPKSVCPCRDRSTRNQQQALRRGVQLAKFLISDNIENDCYEEKGNIFCYSILRQKMCASKEEKADGI